MCLFFQLFCEVQIIWRIGCCFKKIKDGASSDEDEEGGSDEGERADATAQVENDKKKKKQKGKERKDKRTRVENGDDVASKWIADVKKFTISIDLQPKLNAFRIKFHLSGNFET